MSVSPGLRSALRQYFGLAEFRPGQEAAIQALLRGEHVLALLPTGAGKSLIYQLAAQLLTGITIVVSPLIALMKDQVDSTQEIGLAASTVNSGQSESESGGQLESVERGEARLLYVAPERFSNDGFMAWASKQQVSLFVVDEAHCVSEWGHDFRPAYLGLRSAIEQLGSPVVLALTATATPWVRNEIIERLGMRAPRLVIRGFDRPSLYFEVHRVEDETDDYRVLRDLLTGERSGAEALPDEALDRCTQGPGIIYTATTRAAAETAKWLREWGISAAHYHGRLASAGRQQVQDAFMSGELRVIAATNAFGLGVDKPDVRFVIHRDIPGSVEAYYQEAGRAGRDGGPARCALIYRPGDVGRAAALSAGGRLSTEDLAPVLAALRGRSGLSVTALAGATGIGKHTVLRVVSLLKDLRIVAERRGTLRLLRADIGPDGVSLEREEQRRRYEKSRIDMVRAYAELDSCRRQYILNYFGEDYPGDRCDMCDNDRVPGFLSDKDARVPGTPFSIGDRVSHPAWGSGEVQRVDDGRVTVLFDSVGYKTLDSELILTGGLLTKATET